MSVWLKAAKLLEQRGHCKYTMQRADGAMCAVGALRMARFGSTRTPDAEEPERIRLGNALYASGATAHYHYHSVTGWNDRAVCEPQEVIDALVGMHYLENA